MTESWVLPEVRTSGRAAREQCLWAQHRCWDNRKEEEEEEEEEEKKKKKKKKRIITSCFTTSQPLRFYQGDKEKKERKKDR